MDSAPLRSLLSKYIGGGWGKDVFDPDHEEPAWVIRGTDFAAASLGLVDGVPYRFHAANSLKSRRLEPLDILIEVSGGSVDQPVGRVMFADEHILGALDGPAICASFCKRVTPDPEAILPEYLYWFLEATYASGLIERYQVQSTGIRNLQFEFMLDDLQVPLHPPEVQRRIAAALGSAHSLIRVNRRRMNILHEMARLMYAEWFVHFRLPGQGASLIERPVGIAPVGWESGRVEDMIVLQRGFDLPVPNRDESGAVPVLAASGPHGTHSEHKVRGPGVVTGRSGTIGVVAYSAEDFWPLNTVLWVKQYRRSTPRHAYLLLESLELGVIAGGAAVPTLNRNHVHALPAAIPPAQVIEAFDARVAPMFSLISVLRHESRVLAAIRDLLLPRLVSGELGLSDLDLDLESVA